ncbi:DegT/DnrJ/EryC1/StrS family aminotransferase [Catellatospora sichuanensis]|uniref:DegT/DnrJ/EryC1/StrS family aminotransferase n=1 Tax=Catellatospora sichuanensis TaxID=1969805 RepID=UPI00118252E1|nr:DegT/DnrJ/EryC1/StrS family aminotransferase [Catellatospora sichuanensis]
MNVPLVDLRAAHVEVAEEVSAGLHRIMAATAFVGGEEVAAFEREYAAFTGVANCVGLANGTDAVEFALRAAGVGPGDEVIIPANTFVATAEAAHRAGAKIVLADVDPATYLMDVEDALARVTPATKAIVPVHLYGQMAPLERLKSAVGGSGVTIVEDAAQCQGALRHGLPAGHDGIAATSFYPGKNLGAYGDAGAVVTADPDLARKVRLLGSHGGLTRYTHEVIGFNSRLDAMQAVVLRAKLARLAGWNEARRSAAERYHGLLAGLDVVRPVTADGNEHVWHLYVVRVPERGVPQRRDKVLEQLNAAGVGAALHYPTPVHLTPAFAGLGYAAGDFPNAEQVATEILSLPLYPQITPEQQEYVVSVLADALG